jgi:hypothetical protein
MAGEWAFEMGWHMGFVLNYIELSFSFRDNWALPFLSTHCGLG